jgi:hypothetical protein
LAKVRGACPDPPLDEDELELELELELDEPPLPPPPPPPQAAISKAGIMQKTDIAVR